MHSFISFFTQFRRLFLMFISLITLFILIPVFAASNTNLTTKVKSTKKPVKKYSYSYRVKGKKYRVISKSSAKNYHEKGIASWYGGKFHGRKAANGKRYNQYAMTAASKTLPLGSKVKVTNLTNHKSVTVKITDRGPFISGRIIDLTPVAAQKLGFKGKGITRVEIIVIAV